MLLIITIFSYSLLELTKGISNNQAYCSENAHNLSGHGDSGSHSGPTEGLDFAHPQSEPDSSVHASPHHLTLRHLSGGGDFSK